MYTSCLSGVLLVASVGLTGIAWSNGGGCDIGEFIENNLNLVVVGLFFFFQAEDGIRDLVRSRGLGDVYKRQRHHVLNSSIFPSQLKGLVRKHGAFSLEMTELDEETDRKAREPILSLIHI